MYDYKEGKRRIQRIIQNNLVVEKEVEIPRDDHFTYENAYYGWGGAIFVDIRNSTQLFAHSDKIAMSKVIRCFSSEIIEILRDTDQLREIGIRGDCVYGIYSTPRQSHVDMIFNKAFTVNSFLEMLNIVLKNSNLPACNAGIGVACAEELVVKAGRKGVGINNAVWIGEAVTYASKLFSIANKKLIRPIAVSTLVYENLMERKKYNGLSEKWFVKGYDDSIGNFYHNNIVNDEFDKWIKGDMR